MPYDAMIVVDMQTALLEGQPFQGSAVVQNIKRLIGACREKQIPILYICHDGGPGDQLEKGTAGWQVCRELAPRADEKVFDKRFNSAFRQTGLHEYLQCMGAKHLILCGMQTEFCFDVTCKVAFEYGYDVTVPKDTTTTFDSDFASGEALARYYEEKIWNNRYAKVQPVEEVILHLNGTAHNL